MVSSTAVVRGASGQESAPETTMASAYTAASRLMDGMLHEVRNPLNALAINIEVLSEKLRGEDGEVPPGQERNLKAMREQIVRVDGILRRFSDFIAPRPAAGGEVDLGEILLKAVEVAGHDSRKRRVKIKASVETGTAARCQDTSLMHQLLMQPLLRGLARSPQGGELCVSMETVEGRAVVRYEDAGGVQPEPHPEMPPALAILAAQNGAELRIQDGRCELSFPVV